MEKGIEAEAIFAALKDLFIRNGIKDGEKFEIPERGFAIKVVNPNQIEVTPTTEDSQQDNVYINIYQNRITMKSIVGTNINSRYNADKYILVEIRDGKIQLKVFNEEYTAFSQAYNNVDEETIGDLGFLKTLKIILEGIKETDKEEFMKANAKLWKLFQRFISLAKKAIIQPEVMQAVDTIVRNGDLTGVSAIDLARLYNLILEERERREKNTRNEIIEKNHQRRVLTEEWKEVLAFSSDYPGV